MTGFFGFIFSIAISNNPWTVDGSETAFVPLLVCLWRPLKEEQNNEKSMRNRNYSIICITWKEFRCKKNWLSSVLKPFLRLLNLQTRNEEYHELIWASLSTIWRLQKSWKSKNTKSFTLNLIQTSNFRNRNLERKGRKAQNAAEG